MGSLISLVLLQMMVGGEKRQAINNTLLMLVYVPLKKDDLSFDLLIQASLELLIRMDILFRNLNGMRECV